MTERNNSSMQDTVRYGDVRWLLPVSELPCTVFQGRDAELRLERTPPNRILRVGPSNHASAHLLGAHPMILIPTLELPADLRERLQAVIGSIEDYRYIQLGKNTQRARNHALSEF